MINIFHLKFSCHPFKTLNFRLDPVSTQKVRVRKIIELLLNSDCDIDLTDSEGQTALIKAIRYERIDIVKSLLNKGCNINLKNAENKTALMIAISRRNQDIVKILLDSGEELESKDNHGRTALHIALGIKEVGIANLLIQKGADIHAKDSCNNTVLMGAVSNSSVELVEFLLKQGEDFNLNNCRGNSVLMQASIGGSIEILKLFIDKDGIDIHQKNSDGWTALTFAAFHGQTEAVEFLLEHGANINERANDGTTPLMWASKGRHVGTLKKLLYHGADLYAKDHQGHDAVGYSHKESYDLLYKLKYSSPAREIEKIKRLGFFQGTATSKQISKINKFHYRFDQATTTYISWKILLDLMYYRRVGNYKSYEQLANSLNIKAIWYRQDGSILCKQTSSIKKMKRAYGERYLWDSFGWASPGRWEEGFYRVEIYVGNARIVSSSFEIFSSRKQGKKENAISTSDNKN